MKTKNPVAKKPANNVSTKVGTKLPQNVQATYKDSKETYGNFLLNAHPAVHTRPIVPQRNFYKLVQPTDKQSFFINIGRTGTSAISKNPSVDRGQP